MDGLGSTQRILEMQFAQRFRTGNVIFDTIVTGVIITIIGFAFRPFEILISNWRYHLDNLLNMLGMKKGTNKIIIKSKTNGIEGNNSSKRFEAVLHQIMKLKYEDAGIVTLYENPNPISTSFMVSQPNPFTLKSGVFGKIQIDNSER